MLQPRVRRAAPLLALIACGAEPATAPLATTGVLEVRLAPGADTPDGLSLLVDGDAPRALTAAAPVRLEGLTPGDRTLRLTGVPRHCRADWYAPRRVTVTSVGTTQVTYTVRCPERRRNEIVFGRMPILEWTEVWGIGPDGTGEWSVPLPGAVRGITLGPDGGRLLANMSDVTLPTSRTANLGGGDVVQILDTRGTQEAAWSPDGTRIAYTHGATLRLMTADGRDDRVIRTGEITQVSWSPDDTRLALVDNRTIRMYTLDGGAYASISPFYGDGVDQLAWSPDGTRLAFLLTLANGTRQLRTMRPDGTDNVLVRSSQPGPDALGPDFAWSPDGTRLAVTIQSDPFGTMQVATLRASDGGDLRMVTQRPATGQTLRIIGWTP